MSYRACMMIVAALAVSGPALAAGCADADRGLQELNSLSNDLAERVKALQAGHQKFQDAELCQIATRMKVAITHINNCVSPGDSLKGKLDEVETLANNFIGQSCTVP